MAVVEDERRQDPGYNQEPAGGRPEGTMGALAQKEVAHAHPRH
jgi:hypothetical protein